MKEQQHTAEVNSVIYPSVRYVHSFILTGLCKAYQITELFTVLIFPLTVRVLLNTMVKRRSSSPYPGGGGVHHRTGKRIPTW